MERLSENEIKICGELHNFISCEIPECLVVEDAAFSADSLEAVGKVLFQKAVSSVDGASDDLLRRVIRSIFRREEINKEDDYYLWLLSYVGIEKVLKAELNNLKGKFNKIFLSEYPALQNQIQARIDSVVQDMALLETDIIKLIEESNRNKSILKNLIDYESQLSDAYRKMLMLRTEKEMLIYTREFLLENMGSLCDLTSGTSIENKLRKMAIASASNDSIVEYEFQFYQDMVEVIASDIQDHSIISFKVKRYYVVEQIKRKYRSPKIDLLDANELARFKAEIDALDSCSDLSEKRKNDIDEYSQILRCFISDYSIVNDLKEMINKTISIQNRKSLLFELIEQFEQDKFELFVNVIPSQIEGLFEDYIKYGSVFQRFSDLALYPKADLRDKLDVILAKLPNLSLEAILYFRFYFNNLVRNKVAHGVEISSLSNDIPYNVFAMELLLDLNYIVYLMWRTSEAEKMMRYVSGFFKWVDVMGKGKIESAYTGLYNDLVGERIHADFDSLEKYNPIQVLYWIINPYYEHLFKNLIGNSNELIRLRNLLLSEGFWLFVLDKLSVQSIFTKVIDNRFKSVVKGLFNCGASAETKRVLAKVDETLRELNI